MARSRCSWTAPKPAVGTEREVTLLIGRGLSNREIANQLGVGEGTIKTHVARILTKLDLTDRIKVVIYCYERALLRPGDNRGLVDRAE